MNAARELLFEALQAQKVVAGPRARVMELTDQPTRRTT